jgi:hypothetical protein
MKRKYVSGGDIELYSDDDNPEDQEVYRNYQTTGVKVSKDYGAPAKKSVPAKTPAKKSAPTKTVNYKDEGGRLRSRSPMSAEEKDRRAKSQFTAEYFPRSGQSAKTPPSAKPPSPEDGARQHREDFISRVQKQRASEQGNNFRSGGYVKAADGCAKRGKTKAKMV